MKTDATLTKVSESVHYASTRNACKVCTPLGASVAFKGVRGCVPLIHGSQGCSTYIRRYLISHYKEPVDIASTNFSQDSTIFGGHNNFNKGIDNIIQQYNPELIAISSTCLSETIGEDIPGFINSYKSTHKNKKLPKFVFASTPSYQGSHIDGFHEATSALVKAFAEKSVENNKINLFPGFVSTEDIRYLKEILDDFSLKNIILPDYSETLDNPVWEEYQRIPQGGTPLSSIKEMGAARASIEFGDVFNMGNITGRIKNTNLNLTGAAFLKEQFNVPCHRLGMPIGINATDQFFETLKSLSSSDIPEKYNKERGRLIDSYIDGHKYVFGKKAIVYGEEDFVIAMVRFLAEIGVKTVLCASGGESGLLKKILSGGNYDDTMEVMHGIDFETIAQKSKTIKPDILIGNSKGYYIARELNIPLVRVGFPIHDRIGGQRILHLGYRGAQQLFETITNALIEFKQNNSPVGYKYM